MFIKRVLLLLVIFFVVVLSSCTSHCVHCNEHADSEFYPSVLFTKGFEKGKDKFNGDEYEFDLIDNYNELIRYFSEYTNYECEDYFCSYLFSFNSRSI